MSLDEAKCWHYAVGGGGVCGHMFPTAEMVKDLCHLDSKEPRYTGCETLCDLKHVDATLLNSRLVEALEPCICGRVSHEVSDVSGCCASCVSVSYTYSLENHPEDKAD